MEEHAGRAIHRGGPGSVCVCVCADANPGSNDADRDPSGPMALGCSAGMTEVVVSGCAHGPGPLTIACPSPALPPDRAGPRILQSLLLPGNGRMRDWALGFSTGRQQPKGRLRPSTSVGCATLSPQSVEESITSRDTQRIGALINRCDSTTGASGSTMSVGYTVRPAT
ncbi:hypothetical protein CC78DRAFT_577499 [Lojkania enalia]|uniref:Uncharacterized protein n=1 Tax=Lojkania enalia TaxID=147567 RepID=A0A9P4N8W8_9PLEO|nr:hypothetical protein CC78DRAFT_577499 [Didymosphaeria enalia]